MNIKFASSSTIRQSRLYFIAAMILLFLSSLTLGQTTRDSDHKADQNLKSLARVNPATQAMEFSIPLASYPGRGGNSLPISFNYSSKVWTMRQTDFRGRLISGDGYPATPWRYTFITSVTPFFSERTVSGWTSSLGPVSIVPEIESFNSDGTVLNSPQAETSCILMEEYWVNNDPACPFGRHVRIHRCEPEIEGLEPLMVTVDICYNGTTGPTGPVPTPTPFPVPDYKVKRLRLQMPDGSTREFRKDDKVYDCNVENCLPDDGTYLSVDGTGLRLVVGTSVNPTFRSTLFMPDGSRYQFPTAPFSNDPQHFIDKYGNRADYNALTRTWTDTSGRSISDPLPTEFTPQTHGESEFHLPSLGTQNAEYSQKWSVLKPEGCITGNEPICAESALENPADELFSQGNDTCQDRDVDHPTTTSRLFIADPTYTEQVVTQSHPQRWYENTYKFRICGGLFNPVVLHSLTLPDGAKYRFKYNRYGEITKIIYPTGAYERFQYGQVLPLTFLDGPPYDQANRGVVKRWVSEDGVSETQEWNYEANLYGEGLRNVITAPDGSQTETIYFGAISLFGFENPLTGKVLEEKVYSKPLITGNPNSRELLKRTINEYVVAPPRPGGVSQGTRDARTKRSVTLIFEPGSTHALATLGVTEYDETGNSDPEFFPHLNTKRQKGYHYVPVARSLAESSSLAWSTIESWFTSDKLASLSETDYSYDPDYKTRSILGLPTETRVMNPAFPNDPSQALAKTQTVYDNQLPTAPGTYPGSYSVESYSVGNELNCGDAQNPKICWQNPQSSRLGRPTTTRVWNAEGGNWIETHTRYDIFGNAIAARDPVGNETTTEFSAAYKYAYPTKVIAPAPDPTGTTGTNQTSTVETTYDFSTGLPLTVKDDFGQITRTEYDSSLRPWRVFGENFTAPETQTIYGVPDASGQLPADQRFVKVRKQIDASNWDEATTWFDGLGRTVKTRAADSQGDVFVETKYDAMGRVERVTNPYRIGDTVYWSKTRYDAMGRAVESYAPAELANLGSAQSLGVTAFDISTVPGFVGTVVTTTDASGRKGRSITNALGQLIRVDEPTGISASADADLGALATPHQPTSYKYDAHGKMVEVTQGAQKRWFKYDSLGRLIRVRQPEQEINQSLDMADAFNTEGDWTAGFAYDILGNVVRATDANGVNIVNEYDKANRVTKRCYSKPNFSTTATTCAGIGSTNLSTDTPTVEFFYDGEGLATIQTPKNFGRGKLTKVTNGISTTEYMTFDNFGRLTRSRQITDNVVYGTDESPMTYAYNLSGALIEERYPSGRVVKNEFEPDGDLAQVLSRRANDNFRNYANSFSYTASGGISQMRLGNGKWETAKFNTRLQITELGLGASSVNAGSWKVNYDYGELNTDGTVNAAKNTGNIAKQTLTIPGTNFVQSYKYDSLYRLTEAKETTGASQNWIQNWDYDRYGNRTTFSQNVNNVVLNTTPAVNPNTNRFTGTDFGYDANGNVITDRDPVTALTRQFTFNGDNKQIEITSNGTSVGRYFYDGEGKRVKKVVGNETTVFVYSAGKLVAEYSTQLAPQPATNYTTTDHLGSPRIITDQFGQVKSRRDFMPFGEDLNAGIGNRTGDTGQKYSASGDDIKQKFTGYLKDNETGLDFAEARMYENRHGRFTAVDPLLASGKSANPQTFNRYCYTSNNPIVRVDVNGKDWYYHRELQIDRHGRSFYHKIIYWRDELVGGRNLYTGPGIIRETIGRESGMYTALDPYEGRSASFKTRAEAVAQYQSYLRDRNVNATRGFADALAGMVTGNPLTTLLYEWGADAVIGKPDPDSNVYTITNRSTNVMIIVGTSVGAGSAFMALRGAGAAGTGAEVAAATGQRHHLLTNKIMRALNRHDSLKGIFNRQDARFIYNAADEAAHKGYQKWHRRYDQEVTKWLRENADATEEQFLKYLDDLHKQEWLRERIPNVNLGQ